MQNKTKEMRKLAITSQSDTHIRTVMHVYAKIHWHTYSAAC